VEKADRIGPRENNDARASVRLYHETKAVDAEMKPSKMGYIMRKKRKLQKPDSERW